MNFSTQFLINGELVAPAGLGTESSINPSNGEVLAEFPMATQSTAGEAVAAAKQAFEKGPWSKMTPDGRGRLLWKLADLVEENRLELALIETLDQGIVMKDGLSWQIENLVNVLRYYAGYATKIEGYTNPFASPDYIFRTKREPLGVCAVIPGWNAPLMELGWKLGPALATGNTVVVKAARQSPLSILHFGKLIIQAGFPAGVVNIITGAGAESGDYLATHPDVRKISYTGSTATGKHLMKLAADSVKRFSMELGGKNPLIVAQDADIEKAIAGQIIGGYFNAGQICAAYSRTYVHESVAQEFIDKLVTKVSRLKIGKGKEELTDMGPLINAKQVDRVAGYVAKGIEQGAKLAFGGRKPDDESLAKGSFYLPTILTDVTDANVVAKEEIFGPVVNILTYSDDEEVMARVNDTEMGLCGSVFSQDIGRANRFAERIQAGMIWMNTGPILDGPSPWGGYKQSGIGREMGPDPLSAYTESKSIITYIGS